jgi:3'-phosphoadenosine 5'-phosphosulfate sulfotransferase
MNIENHLHVEFNNTIGRNVWDPIWVNICDKTKDKVRVNCWTALMNNVSDVENILSFTFDKINDYEYEY